MRNQKNEERNEDPGKYARRILKSIANERMEKESNQQMRESGGTG